MNAKELGHPADHAFVPDAEDVSMCGECGWERPTALKAVAYIERMWNAKVGVYKSITEACQIIREELGGDLAPSEESGEPRQGGEPSGLVEEDEHDIACRKMKERIRDTAPERIFLNVGPTDSFDEGADFPTDEVTWCKDEIDSFDVPYIRADLVRGTQAAQPPAEAPEADGRGA